MEKFIAVAFDFITCHFVDLINLSISNFKQALESSLKLFLRKFLIGSVFINIFCLSTLYIFFDIAQQYDKTEKVSLTATLSIAVLISISFLILFQLFFREQKIKIQIPKPNNLEDALAVLILEFAKDKEAARSKEQTCLSKDL